MTKIAYTRADLETVAVESMGVADGTKVAGTITGEIMETAGSEVAGIVGTTIADTGVTRRTTTAAVTRAAAGTGAATAVAVIAADMDSKIADITTMATKTPAANTTTTDDKPI